MGRPLDAQGAAPLVAGVRSGFAETVHTGAAVLLSPDGAVRIAVGDADASIYPRSAWKPFQAAAALRAGARFDEQQLAVVCSSHVGSPRHVALVRSVLADAGLDESALQTPSAWPSSEEAARALAVAGGSASPITMNCSGNHAGMLAAAAAAGWSTADYLRAGHPVHALAEQVIEEASGVAPADRGTDGCGGPVWSVPLVALARGLQRVAAAVPAIPAAVRANPDLVQGTGTPTSRAIASLDVFAKSGAEGVWTAVAPDGSALAVKVLGGSGPAAAVTGVDLLRAAGAVDPDAALTLLDELSTVRGGGRAVGRLEPVWAGA